MAKATEKDIEIVTGLENVENKKEAEYDLVAALMEAANYRVDEELVTTVDIKRGGKYFFSVDIHPIGDEEVRKARKKATTYMQNPQNRKLPKIEKEFDGGMFNALIIYAGTTEADRARVWGNRTIMDKYGLLEPYESISVLLTAGEKAALSDKVIEISGMDINEDVSEEEYTKN